MGNLLGISVIAEELDRGSALTLFITAMDVVSSMLNWVYSNPYFSFHSRTKAANISHLWFTDDLLLFYKGYRMSISLLMGALNQFSSYSGLVANPHKSSYFLGNSPSDLATWILETYNIPNSDLSARFLGVTLVASKSKVAKCRPLIDRITMKINSWNSKF